MIVRYNFLVTLLVTMTLIAGCESRDARLAKYAEQATHLQARQNELTAQQTQTVARQGQAIAEATKNLVEQDSTARRELLKAQHRMSQELATERQLLNEQRDELAVQKEQLAVARQREPLVARSIEVAALIFAALLPLLVAIYVLRQIGGREADGEQLTELLIDELATDLNPKIAGPTEAVQSASATTRSPPALPPA